jgi:transcriptional regulator of acetoin/glycerol metabolism
VLGSTELIQPDDLPEAALETEMTPDAPVMKYYELIKEAKKRFILDALEQASGDYTEAAKLLGVHPNNLHRLIRNLNLKSELRK